MEPLVPPIMQYFAFGHLPPHLQEISRPFAELAQKLNADLPNGAEKSAGLRKLLEAKDCMVRAAMPPPASAQDLPGFDRSKTQALGFRDGKLAWLDVDVA